MCLCYILHMNIIPYACPVPRWIVVPEYFHLFAGKRRLYCVGYDAPVIFAYAVPYARACRVEVSKDSCFKSMLLLVPLYYLFHHSFGLGIHAFGSYRSRFINRKSFWSA